MSRHTGKKFRGYSRIVKAEKRAEAEKRNHRYQRTIQVTFDEVCNLFQAVMPGAKDLIALGATEELAVREFRALLGDVEAGKQ